MGQGTAVNMVAQLSSGFLLDATTEFTATMSTGRRFHIVHTRVMKQHQRSSQADSGRATWHGGQHNPGPEGCWKNVDWRRNPVRPWRFYRQWVSLLGVSKILSASCRRANVVSDVFHLWQNVSMEFNSFNRRPHIFCVPYCRSGDVLPWNMFLFQFKCCCGHPEDCKNNEISIVFFLFISQSHSFPWSIVYISLHHLNCGWGGNITLQAFIDAIFEIMQLVIPASGYKDHSHLIATKVAYSMLINHEVRLPFVLDTRALTQRTAPILKNIWFYGWKPQLHGEKLSSDAHFLSLTSKRKNVFRWVITMVCRRLRYRLNGHDLYEQWTNGWMNNVVFLSSIRATTFGINWHTRGPYQWQLIPKWIPSRV